MSSPEISPKITPLHEPAGEADFVRMPPHNYEAEMALLGAVLANNRAYEKVQDFLRVEHFADAIHGRIYQACERLIDRGQLATPITLKAFFEHDETLSEVGGTQYLARLANAVLTIQNAHDLGRIVYDCALRRELIDIGDDMVNAAYSPDLDDTATSQIELAEEKLFGLAEQGEVEGGLKDFKSALIRAIDMAEAAYKRDGDLVGVPTGFRDLDQRLGGLHESDLLIIAARPSMGKTALATNIAFNAANSKRRRQDENGTEVEDREVVAFFSLEMSSDQLATRIISQTTAVRSDAIRRGAIGEDDFGRIFDVTRQLHTLPLFIDDTPALSVTALRTRARRLKRQQGLSLIIVDYLQLMRPTQGMRSENRVQEVSDITRGLKAIAKELSVPVIALSQLSRAVEQRDDKRPQLSDLRESGSIEQDADVVMFIYREEYYRDRDSPAQRDSESDEKFAERAIRHEELLANCRNKAEVILAKQRHGPIGTVNMTFDGNTTTFNDAAQEDHLPERR